MLDTDAIPNSAAFYPYRMLLHDKDGDEAVFYRLEIVHEMLCELRLQDLVGSKLYTVENA